MVDKQPLNKNENEILDDLKLHKSWTLNYLILV